LAGDHDAGGQHHPEQEPEHPCSRRAIKRRRQVAERA
jgi:hypothetical protein